MKIIYKDVILNLNGVKQNEIVEYLKDALQSDVDDIVVIDKSLIKISFDSKTEAYSYLSDFIYSKYSQEKQNQDEKFVSAYTTKLKALDVEKLELKIVQMATSFFKGDSLTIILKDIPDEQKKYFEKLVKAGVRMEWLENCIAEGNLAISEDREAVYSIFPTF